MRGRIPKPIEQRIREGRVAHRPLPEVVLISGRPVPGEMVEPPEHLSEDAKRFWSETIVQLAEIGMVDRADIPMLEQLATQYARICQVQRVIAETGHFALGSTGQVVEHPALKIEREATSMFLKLAEHYGLTPVARARLGLAHLHGRALEAEMRDALGPPELRPVGHG